MKKKLQQLALTVIGSLLFFHARTQISIQTQSITIQDHRNPFVKPETLVTEGNVFVRAIASKASCVVDEPILVTYKFYTRLDGQSKVSEMPTFTGCSVQEMTTNDIESAEEEYNGKKFKTIIIRKVQLYPLHVGDIVLGSASVESSFSVYTKGSSMDDIRNGKAQLGTKTIVSTSQPVTIHVNGFPEKNKPAAFDGAVGNFFIKATVNKHNDTANENNTLQILIEGEGCFQTINCPIVQWPAGIEHFEAKATETVDKFTFPSAGTKVFDIPFVAKQPGKFVIPAISFCFYNMATQQYQTVTAENLELDVAAALPNKIDTSKISGNITNYKYIWFVPAIALIVGVSLLFKYKSKKPSVQQLINNADQMIEQEAIKQVELEATREKTNEEKLNLLLLSENDSSFYSDAKLLIRQLLAKETATHKINSLQQLQKQCNEALYANNRTVTKDDVFRQLEDLVKEA